MILQTHFLAQKAIWKLVALKSKKYLAKALKLSNVKEVDEYLKTIGKVVLRKGFE